MRELITTACAGCKEKLERLYYMDELDEEPRMRRCPWCGSVYWTGRYSYSSRQPQRRRRTDGPPTRDTRARYRGPWKER